VRPNRGIPATTLEPSLTATEHSKRPHRTQTDIRGSIQKSRRETRRTKIEDTGRREKKNRENKKKEKADKQRGRERILRAKESKR
jgi:hypothetical protein